MDRIDSKPGDEDERIALKLGGSTDAPGAGAPTDTGAANTTEPAKPIVGWVAVGLGVFGILVNVLAIPFAVAFSVAALFVGQTAWGIGGLVLSVLGIITSPTVVALLGIGAILAMFGL